MHPSINELEHSFDLIRQAVLHAHEKMKDRIANTAAAYTNCDPFYALVPLVAIISDASLGFAGGYELVRSWVPVPVLVAPLDALASLALAAGLVIMCWLSDLCRESGPTFRRCAFGAFSFAPMLIFGAPVVYYTIAWIQAPNWLELERLLKVGAVALIAAISHSVMFFEGRTCRDAIHRWLLGRDKKAFADQVVRLRDAARDLVSACNAVRLQAEQQKQESGAHGFHLPLKNLVLGESVPGVLAAARAVLSAQDLVEVVAQMRHPMQNQPDQFEELPSALGAEAGD